MTGETLARAVTHPVVPGARDRQGHSWAPVSACTARCLPAPGDLPSVSRGRAAARLCGMAGILLLGLCCTALLPLVRAPRRALLLRRMFRGLLRAAGVRLVHIGPDRFDTGSGGGVLVVANHLSWLDILGLGAVQPMRMVAKQEIRSWPVLGGLADRLGTLFVDRGGLRGLPSVVAHAAEALRDGSVVGLFPEGTTWCGAASGPFRRAGFQAALDAGVPVRPVAQRMRLADGRTTSVGAFIGDDTLVDSLLRVVRLPELVLEVQVLPLLVAGAGTDRRELARRAELAVAAATGVPAPPPVSRPSRRARPAAEHPAPLPTAA